MPLKIQRDDQTTINLTPMIDIVFLLIIFFMVGTHFSDLNEQERDIALQVPTVSDAQALTSAPRNRVINVYHDGRIVLDSQEVNLQTLQSELISAREQYERLGVVIRGARNVEYQRVMDVIHVCKKADISELNVAAQTTTLR